MAYESYQRLGELFADSNKKNRVVWRMYLAHAQYAVTNSDLCDDLIALAERCGSSPDYDGL